MTTTKPRKPGKGSARASARLAAVQALYQREMSGDPVPKLLAEFHNHRLGATIEGAEYRNADPELFDDLVSGAVAREAEIDALISANLASGWALDRLDRPMRAILRAGVYELLARHDVPTPTVINEYLDVAHAFYDAKETAFANALLDAVARLTRS